MRRARTDWLAVSILFLALGAIFWLDAQVTSALSSPSHLATDLGAPPASPQAWTVQHNVPTKYRVLYRWIVQATCAWLCAPDDAPGFYRAFFFWGYIFFAGTLAALYYYLRALDFTARWAFAGGVLFLVSPPVAFAYKYPVFTREDPLAYGLVLLGLLAMFKQNPRGVALAATLGALTRETTLIVPLVYAVAARAPWRVKVGVCAPPLIAALGIRVALGWASYDPFVDSIYNFETPWQTLAFLFCVFGFLWLPYLLQMRALARAPQFASDAWRILGRTAPLILALVLGTHLVLARAREIRIAFLLFPWAIPFALAWFHARRAQLGAWVRRPTTWVLTLAGFGLLTSAVVFTKRAFPGAYGYLADFNNNHWLILGNLHVFVTLVGVVPLLWLARRARNDSPGAVF